MSASTPAHSSPPPVETVGVIGLGYVGLPLAVALARGGLRRVSGFDISADRVAEINAGHDRTREVTEDQLQAALASSFVATAEDTALDGHEVYIVTVPTPVDTANRPDLGPLRAACRTIGAVLVRRSPTVPAPIVVLESTVYPGVTEDICGPTIESASGRR